jgi:hypothetical protein
MNSYGNEKRKNDAPHGVIPNWVWALVIGFILGVVATLLVVPSRIETITNSRSDSSDLIDPIQITATYVVERATQTAQAEKTVTQAAAMGTITPEREIDPIYITATYIIDRATKTQQAIATLTAYPTAIPYF